MNDETRKIALDREAVIDLMDGKPTTLHAGIERYRIEVAGRDELQSRDRILAELGMLLAYPWPGEHPDLRASIEAYEDELATAVALAPGDCEARAMAEVVDRLFTLLR